MTPHDLLDLAETRLLALDEEVRAGGSFVERAAVVEQLHQLAVSRASVELIRNQVADQRALRRTGGGLTTEYADRYELP